jgi:hypothetical protein
MSLRKILKLILLVFLITSATSCYSTHIINKQDYNKLIGSNYWIHYDDTIILATYNRSNAEYIIGTPYTGNSPNTEKYYSHIYVTSQTYTPSDNNLISIPYCNIDRIEKRKINIGNTGAMIATSTLALLIIVSILTFHLHIRF